MNNHKPLFNQVTIIGVGLIGGSLALAGREQGIFNRVIGMGRNPGNLKKAKELGVIDDYALESEEGVRNADLVVIATPVSAIVPCIKNVAPHLKEGATISDVGSVKQEIVEQVDALDLQKIHFVGGHPIAGTENSGVEAAFPALFRGRKCCLTPSDKTNPAALEEIKRLWESLGSTVVTIESALHDKILGAVSHLPHFIAFTLVNFLDEINRFDNSLFEFSAGGLKDFTRIAGSDPEMWKDIALMNREHIVWLIDEYVHHLESLKNHILDKDSESLFRTVQRSRSVQRTIISTTEPNSPQKI
ncbi:MAG: prephenate dehydrogenase/arogenate dehydrogenase family protein [Deltaproteobacteria bacterium]|nr:prephenate dehydrogenase/arogenate dehydrogenase family protein [Deltaproteobacteria bacterium]